MPENGASWSVSVLEVLRSMCSFVPGNILLRNSLLLRVVKYY